MSSAKERRKQRRDAEFSLTKPKRYEPPADAGDYVVRNAGSGDLHGPFYSKSKAQEWADKQGDDYYVMKVYPVWD